MPSNFRIVTLFKPDTVWPNSALLEDLVRAATAVFSRFPAVHAPVLKNLDISIAARKVAAVVGPNCAEKSTRRSCDAVSTILTMARSSSTASTSDA